MQRQTRRSQRPADDEYVAATVRKVIYSNPNGYTVVELRVKDELLPITAVGDLSSLSAGEDVSLWGSWQQHSRFGRQFKVARWESTAPDSKEGLFRYLSSGVVSGIGPGLAERLVEHFGTELFTVAETEPKRLMEVEGIGRGRCDKIAKSLAEQRKVRSIMVFLRGLELGAALATRVYRKWGDDAIAQIKRDPYRLAIDIEGVGFATADAVARRLGVEADSSSRIIAGLLHLCQEATTSGHTVVAKETLCVGAAAFLECPEERVEEAVDQLLVRGDLIARKGSEGESLVGLPLLVTAELQCAVEIAKIAAQSPRNVPRKHLKSRALEELSGEQRRAVELAAAGPICVITGGPGTGKTTVLCALVKLLGALEDSYALCAPTGRAAKRMSETSGAEAKTIHRLLGYRGAHFEYRRGNPLSLDTLIVDEASMIDVPLMQALLLALPPKCRLVLVGDADQLPSVGPGYVLGDLIASENVPIIRLTTVFRQDETSRIVWNAHQIRVGEIPEPSSRGATDTGEFHFVEAEDSARAQKLVLEVCCERIPGAFGLDPIDDVQVLSPMHRGQVGTEALNKQLQAQLNAASAGLRYGHTEFRIGDKVMQVRNDYDRDVFNGDIGRVLSIDRDKGSIVVDMGIQPVSYSAEQLRQLSLAYCVSIHKSQGSEYPAVVIPLLTEHYILLERNLLYTAVTRARKLVVIVGSKKALKLAVTRVDRSRRNTLLATELSRVMQS